MRLLPRTPEMRMTALADEALASHYFNNVGTPDTPIKLRQGRLPITNLRVVRLAQSTRPDTPAGTIRNSLQIVDHDQGINDLHVWTSVGKELKKAKQKKAVKRLLSEALGRSPR